MRLEWEDRWVDRTRFLSSVTDAEIAKLRELAEDNMVLEIGTAYGYATCQMAQVATHVVTVDPHMGYGTLGDSLPVAQQNIRELGLAGRVSVMVGKSQDFLPMLSEVVETRFDLVFVDGDHSFAAVKRDLLEAQKILTLDGVLAVHDYGEDTCPQVALAVDDVFGMTVAHELVDTLWVLS
jgi:predicted O-methyltransferase YrrM